MLKAMTPATVYTVAVFMGTEKWSVRTLGIMLVIVFGVAISAHGAGGSGRAQGVCAAVRHAVARAAQ